MLTSSCACSSQELPNMATKTEHWTQRVPRELREVKAMNEMLLGFVEVKGLMAEWKDYSDKTGMSVFASASGSGDPPQKSGKKPSGGDPDGGDDGSDGDGEGSDDQDGDPFENQSDSDADDYIQISVVKQFSANSKNVSKVFTVSASWTVGSLKWMIWCKWKIPVNHQIYLFSNGDQVLEHLTFAQNGVNDNGIIYLQLGIRGGVNVNNKFVKRADALAHLKEKATTKLNKLKEEIPNRQTPDEYDALIQIYRSSVDDVKMMKANGSRVIATGLRHLTDSDLDLAKDIMSFSGIGRRRGTTEDKLPQLLELLFPKMTEMSFIVKKLTKDKELMCSELLSIYAEEYFSFENGCATFNNELFNQDWQKEKNRRETLRSVNVAVPEERGCVLC